MNSTLLQILTPIAVAVSTGVAGIIGYYFKIGTSKLQAEAAIKLSDNDRALAYTVLSDVNDCINTAVINANQTIVDGLKSASADGKLSEADATQIFTEVVTNAKALIGDSLYKDLIKLKPDAEAWILAKVNYYVSLNKKTVTTSTPIQSSNGISYNVTTITKTTP